VHTAAAILRQADVAATWLDCSTGAAARHLACASPLAPGEIAIRITPGPPDPHPAATRPLGYSLVDPAAGLGTLGTVFSDRVAWLAAAAHSRPETLLGRAVAHEIGHLLLGTNEHSPTGLMRAVWTASDLSRNRRDDWLFTGADRTRLLNSRIGNADARLAETSAASRDSS
jgi:hypothetical protein